MSDLETFRAESRAWLDEQCPDEMRKPGDVAWGGRTARFSSDDQKLWLERMADKGWTVPTWPRDCGGAGLSKEEAAVIKQEMRDLGCRTPLNSFGIMMLGPVVLQYGTKEQKRKFLPPIARGEIRWCQGYSEPGAGSDLANVQCRAVRDGDDYVVNGQKIWTSEAHLSDWIFCLVRTNTEASKHDGISFLLIDMDDPGVLATPTPLISGTSIFCQTFFDDVRVPVIWEGPAGLMDGESPRRQPEVFRILLRTFRDAVGPAPFIDAVTIECYYGSAGCEGDRFGEGSRR